MEEKITITKLQKEHIDALVEMDQAIFSDPWSEKDYNRLLELSYSHYLVMMKENRVIGFAGMMDICNEGNIDKVMITPNERKNGYGQELLAALLQLGDSLDIVAYTLEVRISNKVAISLYEKMGFKNEGIRPNFYEKPVEDAVIMWKR